MAKRFIDTKIWDKAWFRRLTPKNKLFWIYLLTKCDHAGIWDADWEAAEFLIGEWVNFDELPSEITDKMEYIKGDDQYFIPKFIEFQYGVLKANSKPHLSVIKRLTDKGLMKGIESVSITLKDKDKDKVLISKRMSKKNQIDKIDLENLKTDFKNVDVSAEFLKWKDWMASKGKTYKNYNAAFRNWLRSDFVKPKEMIQNEKMHYTGSKLPN